MHLGSGFTNCDEGMLQQDIVKSSFDDCDVKKLMMFVNAPGVDPKQMIKDMKIEGTDIDIQAMGEHMEKIAVTKIEEGKTNGNWVLLENIHLMVDWLKELNKIIDEIASGGGGSSSYINNKFRLFLTTDACPDIPISIMERTILTIIEPPAGIKPNMKKAWVIFNTEKFNDKDPKEKNILFALSYFHSMMVERKR